MGENTGITYHDGKGSCVLRACIFGAFIAMLQALKV